MRTYTVTPELSGVWTFIPITVEAEDEDDAHKKAKEVFANREDFSEDGTPERFVEGDGPIDFWNVEEADD